jgi:hypothetical protein
VENPSAVLTLLVALFIGGSFWVVIIDFLLYFVVHGHVLQSFSVVVAALVVAFLNALLTELFTFKGICLAIFAVVAWRIYKKLSEIAQTLNKLK